MPRGAGDPHENYLSRYRLRLLTDEWLEAVAQARPADPFSYLVGLIEDYSRDGRGLVTCENKWCEMVVPASEYAAHLSSCSQEGKWVKCTRCNTRVEAARMRQHKRHCHLECCAYCGEMVVPRLRDVCPYRLKLDAERAGRRRTQTTMKRADTTLKETIHQTSSLPNFSVDSSAPDAPLYSRVPLSFPSALKGRLICFQNLWRSAAVKERLQDMTFKRVWEALEFYRESLATREHIAVSEKVVRESSPHHSPLRLGAPAPVLTTTSTAAAAAAAAIGKTGGGISIAEFETVAKTATSGAVVELATAVRIVSSAIAILTARPLVQRVTVPEEGDVVVIGDLHGQMKDLLEVLALTGHLPNQQRYFVFNGDFVDRGPNGMEVILYIFSLMCAFPSFVFINRGNHEDSRVNAEYGFQTEVYGKYGLEDAKQLMELLVASYEAMPLMTVLDETILIVHGGVPRTAVTLEHIDAVGRMRDIPTAGQTTEAEQIVVDILWNDPVEKFRSRQLGLRHQGQHWRTSKRGCGAEYLAPITEEFLRLNHLKLVVRSHEMVQAGFALVHNGKCCTVFSASDYAGVSRNRAALAMFQKGSLKPAFYTWYVRDEDEGGAGSPTTRELLRNFRLSAVDDEDGEEMNGDEGKNKKEKSDATAEVRGSVGIGKNSTTDIINGNDRGSGVGTKYPILTDGQLLYRLNMLRAMSEIIYRKRYALLSGFVTADYRQNGAIYKIEWCDVMRNVLDMDLPWYFLCQFLATQQEMDDVPSVRYVPFLRRFTARFSAQYLPPFQLAIVRRIFGDMDMPEDILNRLDKSELSATISVSHGLYLSATEGQNSTSNLLSDGAPGFARPKLSSQRSYDVVGSETPRCPSSRERWRMLRLDFNLLVSILRSQSAVAASLEDNAMYALFQYLDQDECGHVTLGNLTDLVENALAGEAEESVVVVQTCDPFNMDFSFSVKDNAETHTKRDDMAAMAPPFAASTPALTPLVSPIASAAAHDKGGVRPAVTIDSAALACEEKPLVGPGEKLRLSSLVIACESDATGTHRPTRRRTMSRSVSRQSIDAGDESTAEALWLYPALLRLHESFDYGSLRSLQQSFRSLNRTGDGKLTFDQLNVALQLIGRHMLRPLTAAQCNQVFSAIRDVGQLLSQSRPNDGFADSRAVFPNELLTPAAGEESTLVRKDSDTQEPMFITLAQFSAFFTTTMLRSYGQGSSTTSESLKMMRLDETSISTAAFKSSKVQAAQDLVRQTLQSDVLGSWTVESLWARFDGRLTLRQALQDLLGSSSTTTPSLQPDLTPRYRAPLAGTLSPPLSPEANKGSGMPSIVCTREPPACGATNLQGGAQAEPLCSTLHETRKLKPELIQGTKELPPTATPRIPSPPAALTKETTPTTVEGGTKLSGSSEDSRASSLTPAQVTWKRRQLDLQVPPTQPLPTSTEPPTSSDNALQSRGIRGEYPLRAGSRSPGAPAVLPQSLRPVHGAQQRGLPSLRGVGAKVVPSPPRRVEPPHPSHRQRPNHH